jgi:hypothetical protein
MGEAALIRHCGPVPSPCLVRRYCFAVAACSVPLEGELMGAFRESEVSGQEKWQQTRKAVLRPTSFGLASLVVGGAILVSYYESELTHYLIALRRK